MDPLRHHGLPGADVTAVEVVFCSRSRNIVELDCVAADGSEADWPFTMRLGLAMQEPWSAAAERALMRWAAQGVVVSVQVRGGRGLGSVRLAAGGTSILLELAGASSERD